MIKATAWNGKDLKGTWEVTLKIDGVRALWTSVEDGGREWLSRAGKVLYNIPPPANIYMDHDCEVYMGPEYGDQKGRFKATIRAIRTQTPKQAECSYRTPNRKRHCSCGSRPLALCKFYVPPTPVIRPDHLYSLDPLDVRLRSFNAGNSGDPVTNPTAEDIRNMMKVAVEHYGYEGLVLRQGGVWLKVKPEETHDVLITGAIEGTGKHKGRLGALMTAKGKVGTGFSDEERENLWLWFKTGHSGDAPVDLIGQTIEVSCMAFTPDGKFRHPRFVRMRPDKIAEA